MVFTQLQLTEIRYFNTSKLPFPQVLVEHLI